MSVARLAPIPGNDSSCAEVAVFMEIKPSVADESVRLVSVGKSGGGNMAAAGERF